MNDTPMRGIHAHKKLTFATKDDGRRPYGDWSTATASFMRARTSFGSLLSPCSLLPKIEVFVFSNKCRVSPLLMPGTFCRNSPISNGRSVCSVPLPVQENEACLTKREAKRKRLGLRKFSLIFRCEFRWIPKKEKNRYIGKTSSIRGVKNE